MMTLPRRHYCSLPIGGYSVDVYLTHGLAEDHGADGLWDPDAREIHLDADLCLDQRIEVLLHECIHVVSDYYGIGIESEQTITTLGVGLHQMLGAYMRPPPETLDEEHTPTTLPTTNRRLLCGED